MSAGGRGRYIVGSALPLPRLNLRIHIPCFALLAACSSGTDGPADPTANSTEGSQSGAEIYAAYCASCHGVDGDGQGLAALDRPARSFADGGFSFGNTVQALRRTIASGIAGTPMPGFGAVLSDEELTLLAVHVRSLGPETIPDPGDAARLEVGDRPLFVRGQLAPLVEGGPVIPRGLLVGTVDGLSWEYQIDDVRLLAVRQGEFVKRTDWTGRGGTPLKPLGRRIDSIDGADIAGPFYDAAGRALRSRLRSTRTEAREAILRYELAHAEGGEILATIEESCRAAPRTSAPGYTRDLRIERARDCELAFAIGVGTSATDVRSTDGSVWRRASSADDNRVFGLRLFDAEDRAVPFDVHAEASRTLVAVPAGTAALRLEISTLLPAAADPATWSKIREELSR